ncbi:hypothetical protein J19TS2_60640 [Cohnella xylanilytica]|nr:hypothetical protein J19TS2_60640 [Cohnella xylanilytica]
MKYSYPDMLRTNEYPALNGCNFPVMQGANRLLLPALAMTATVPSPVYRASS